MPASLGIIVDANVIQKKIGQLKKLIAENKVSEYKTLSTAILANVTAMNVTLQASTGKHGLDDEPSLDIDIFGNQV